MATSLIDLEDFTCSICREIFESPVSLACSHSYCHACLTGLKKEETTPPSTPTPSLENSKIKRSPSTRTLIYVPQVYASDQYFVCAICRTKSAGYLDCRDLETDLKTLEGPCPHCSKPFVLRDIRKHVEKCPPPKKAVNPDVIKNLFTNKDFLAKLSQPQAQALEQARNGENRSTFPCPYCSRANFTVEHLCKHIEKHHLSEHPSRICPICATMPWGDRERVSANVYQHIMSRHRFDYNTYVNYEQDEEAMIAEAIQRSMLYH